MQVVNDGIPEPLFRMVQDQRPPTEDPFEISVTQLIGPPQIRDLMREYWERITENASDRIWMADGTSLHESLAKHAGPDEWAEHAIRTPVMSASGQVWTLTGTFDHFTKTAGVLTDYKRAGMATFFKGVKPEMEQQLNVYAWILAQDHEWQDDDPSSPTFEQWLPEGAVNVHALEITAIYRDWVKRRAKTDADYPQRPVETFPVDLWLPDEQGDFVLERLRAHEDGDDCSDADRWKDPPRYAVRKKTHKRATRVFDTEREAEDYALLNRPRQQWSVDTRTGTNVRCADYCVVSPYCPQYQQIQEEDDD